MISPRWLLTVSLFALTFLPLHAQDATFQAPDSLILKNGKVVRGLIIKNSVFSVVIDEKLGENTYPKSDIVRIIDNANPENTYSHLNRKGELPPWRVIINDLRSHDEIKSLVEIPATIVDVGEFAYVPYLSFRANQDIEMNIYGDPSKPAGFEIGIYGSRSRHAKLRQTIRAFLAGYLTTRQEIATLYSLNLTGGINDVGNLTIEVTPPNGSDAYGAWWISLYNKKKLAGVRLSKSEYLKITRPENEVVDKRGRVISSEGWTSSRMGIPKTIKTKDGEVLLRGFYRDKNGNFRLITEPVPAKSSVY